MSDEWVTLMTFSQPLEAHVIKSKLESEEVDCMLADENIVRMDWLWSNAVGGVKLKVHESQVEKALEILRSGSPDETESCPFCHSTDVVMEVKHRRGLLFSVMFFGIPLPFTRKRVWRCQSCEKNWDPS